MGLKQKEGTVKTHLIDPKFHFCREDMKLAIKSWNFPQTDVEG